MSVDICLSATGYIEDAPHLYGYGWLVSFDDVMAFIYLDMLSLDQCDKVDAVRPYPIHTSEDAYWEENALRIFLDIYPQPYRRLNQAGITQEVIDGTPEIVYAKLRRMIPDMMSPQASNVLPFPELVAISSSQEIVSAASSIVTNYAPENTDLVGRLLESFGCDGDGDMPRAHDALLRSDPLALLLLPQNHAVFGRLNVRDQIQDAVAWEAESGDSTEIAEAFRTYRHERRYLASLRCLDLSVESHGAVFGIPSDSIVRIFSPKLLSARLPIAPQGDVLHALQARYDFYRDGMEPPEFREVLKVITGRSIAKMGNMSYIASWIFKCCDNYRYILSGIEPDITLADRKINKDSNDMLMDSLREIARILNLGDPVTR